MAVLRPSRMKGSKHVCESVPRVLPSKARFLVLICSTDRSTYRARVPYWISRRAMADQSESFLRVGQGPAGLPAAASTGLPDVCTKESASMQATSSSGSLSIAYFGIMSRKLCQSLRPKSVWPRPAPELTTRCPEAIAHLASKTKTDKERAHCAVLGHPNHPQRADDSHYHGRLGLALARTCSSVTPWRWLSCPEHGRKSLYSFPANQKRVWKTWT